MLKKAVNNIRYRSRLKKLEQMTGLLKASASDKVLEVGIADKEYSPVDNFLIKAYPWQEKITALGIGDVSGFGKLYPKVRAVSYNGRIFPFKKNEFDIVHSNAVIEHVGSGKDQELFLKEMARVAKRGMLTTPNRHFPIETHTRVPFLHWMGKKEFDKILVRIGKGWAAGPYMSLLCEKDLCALAEKAKLRNYRIIKNRLLGLTMTFTLIWFND
jgi:hypothetical protein